MSKEVLLGTDNSRHQAGMGLNPQMLPVFLGLLLAATIAWFFLSSKLYTGLRQQHPELYEKLGKPGPIMHKSVAANFKVLRFLFMRHYLAVGDPALTRKCQGLRSLLVIYLICLIGSLILLLGT